MDLPQLDGYHSVQQIRNLPDNLKRGHYVNVIGFIYDFQSPIETSGTSWKCTVDIIDHSVRESSSGLQINIFWSEARMPSTPNFADVIIVSHARTQIHGGYLSLVAKNDACIFILPANEIPKNKNDAAKIKNSWVSYSDNYVSNTRKLTAPSVSETKYAISMNNKRNDIVALTVQSEFRSKSDLGKNTKEKFGLIKDVKADYFYNVIGEVRKFWPSSDAWATVYLSDYTANSLLFDYKIANESPNSFDQDGDEFNYTNAFKKKTNIPGPYGNLVIQITLWDEDAAFIRDHIQCGNWLYIKNVRIKLGQNNLLEGVVHSEDGKIHVQHLKSGNCPMEINKRWKTALQRKQAWWYEFEQNLLGESKKQTTESLRKKRQLDDGNDIPDSKNKNGKQRRKERRLEAEKKAAKKDAKLAACLELNDNVKASYEDQLVVPLRSVLQNSQLSKPGLNVLYAPFSNFKYKVTVRVIDYFPHYVEDFAIHRLDIEKEISSDGTEVEDNCQNEQNNWEWRFSLLLEDASNTKNRNKERVWVIVNNHAAQGLLNIQEDAADLRMNRGLLDKVKEQLFKLWGDLEERKSAQIQKHIEESKNEPPPLSTDSGTSSPSININIGNQPDLESESENETFKRNLWHDEKAPSTQVKVEQTTNPLDTINKTTKTLDLSRFSPRITPSNKAFTCCIQQYGVKVPEADASKADAGHQNRWQRMYGLFGTTIL